MAYQNWNNKVEKHIDKNLLENDKSYMDQKLHTKQRDIQAGDRMLVKQQKMSVGD